MGSWYFEVGKMFVYIMFPVATFYIYNQPEIFEDWVIQTKKEMNFPVTLAAIQEKNEFKEEMNKLKANNFIIKKV